MHDEQDQFVQLLRHAKVRVTGVRLGVLAVLQDAGQPLSAQQVFDAAVSSIKKGRGKDTRPDRVTVYRTLNSLVDAGIAHKVDPGDRIFRFRLTNHTACDEHGHDHEHPHFVCDDCGEVECLEGAKVLVKAEDRAGQSMRPGKGKRTVRQDVTLRGTCGECVGGGPKRRK